jgi:hypothetical protein
MNKFKLLIIASFLLIGLSCQKDDLTDQTPYPPQEEEDPLSVFKPITGLKGSQWKLAGYADTQTDEMIAAEPADCEHCYTFTFDTDYSGFGYSIINQMFYLIYPRTMVCVTTLVDDEDNGNAKLFYEAIQKMSYFGYLGGDEIKFFYNDGKNYLLYKRIKQ